MEFLSPMIWFPLMLLGTEKLLKENKKAILIFSIWYAAMCGFYFLYMTSVVWAVYSLIRAIMTAEKDRKKAFALCLSGTACYLLAIGLAAPIFFPAVYAFLQSAREASHPLQQIRYEGRISAQTKSDRT